MKYPPSISEKEALKITQGQGLNNIIAVTKLKDGSTLIEAK